MCFKTKGERILVIDPKFNRKNTGKMIINLLGTPSSYEYMSGLTLVN